MTRFTCVPIYLFPDSRIGFKRCEVVPGVVLKRITSPLKELVKKSQKRMPDRVHVGFFPSHVIMIELEKHLDYLTTVYAAEGFNIPKHPFDDKINRAELIVDARAITQHVLMSLLLSGEIQFRVGGHHRLRANHIGSKVHYVESGYSHCETEGSYGNPFVSTGGKTITSGRMLRKTAKQIERYYRSYSFWSDRLGMSLSHVWSSVCTKYLDHSYVGFSMALEAALSTGRDEITHKIAERAALLLRTNVDERVQTYTEVKKLYATRSKLVHGSAYPKKGKLTTESLAITSRLTYIPFSQGKSIFHLTISVLNALIADRGYLSVVQDAGLSEDKVDMRVDALFTRRIFQSKCVQIG